MESLGTKIMTVLLIETPQHGHHLQRHGGQELSAFWGGLEWEFPKKGDPNLVHYYVGPLL